MDESTTSQPLTEQQVMAKLGLKPWVEHELDQINGWLFERAYMPAEEILRAIYTGRGFGSTTHMLVSAVQRVSEGHAVTIAKDGGSPDTTLTRELFGMCKHCGIQCTVGEQQDNPRSAVLPVIARPKGRITVSEEAGYPMHCHRTAKKTTRALRRMLLKKAEQCDETNDSRIQHAADALRSFAQELCA